MNITKTEMYTITMNREEIEYIISLYNSCLSEGLSCSDEFGIISSLSEITGIKTIY